MLRSGSFLWALERSAWAAQSARVRYRALRCSVDPRGPFGDHRDIHGGPSASGRGCRGGAGHSSGYRYRSFPGREIAKLFSALLQVMIAPIVAPPIGGALLVATGWRGIFWVLAAFGAALLKIVPETLKPADRPTSGLRVALLDYASLFRRGKLTWLTLSSGFAMAGLFAYIGSSSFVFVDHFGISPTVYSMILAGNAIGMVVCGQVNTLLLKRWSEARVLVLGLLLHGTCCTVLLFATFAFAAGVYLVGGLIFLIMASLMLVVGNGFALVMQSAPMRLAGAVSSLLGVVQYVFAGLAGAALALTFDGTLTPFIVTLLLCAAGSLGCFLVTTRPTAGVATSFAE